jgi:O-antigen ligase
LLQTEAGRQRYLLGIWMAMGVLTPIIGWAGTRGYAPAIAVMGLLCLPIARPTGRDWIGLGLAGALTLWACVSSLWSPADVLHGVHSLKELERFTGVHMALQAALCGAFVIAAARLNPEPAERSLRWLGFGMLALAAILVVEGLTQAAVYQRVQAALGDPTRPDLAVRNVAVAGYIVAVLLWPVCVALWRERRRLMVGCLVGVVAFSTVFLRGDAPTLAVVISAVVFAVVLKLGRPAIVALAALAALYFLALPWAMLAAEKAGLFAAIRDHLPASWGARLDIWSFTNGKMLEDPLRGWGIDASRMFPGYIHLHPHDGAVQVWFELGALGAILGAAFWGFIFWRISEAAEQRLFAATACATATVYLVIGAISFSLWQEWWVCLGAFAMGACVVLKRFVSTPFEDWATLHSGAPPQAA